MKKLISMTIVMVLLLSCYCNASAELKGNEDSIFNIIDEFEGLNISEISEKIGKEPGLSYELEKNNQYMYPFVEFNDIRFQFIHVVCDKENNITCIGLSFFNKEDKQVEDLLWDVQERLFVPDIRSGNVKQWGTVDTGVKAILYYSEEDEEGSMFSLGEENGTITSSYFLNYMYIYN